MPLERLADEHRAQMLIESPRREALHGLLRAWLPELRAAVAERKLRARWYLEVDPAAI
jgi:primosomal protein N' (replication factor Y)